MLHHLRPTSVLLENEALNLRDVTVGWDGQILALGTYDEKCLKFVQKY